MFSVERCRQPFILTFRLQIVQFVIYEFDRIFLDLVGLSYESPSCLKIINGVVVTHVIFVTSESY